MYPWMKMKSSSPQRLRHIPERTCVACRSKKAKRELVRLVCAPDESVEVDITGKKAGRGAYLCLSPDCWESGLRGGRLERALRITLTQDNREQILKVGRDVLQGAA